MKRFLQNILTHPRLFSGIFGWVALTLLGLYLSVLPERLPNPKLGLDAGDFLSALLTGGIPHPTGYPTYMILGRLFQLLPWGTPVWKASLFSALAAASAGGLVAAWSGRLWERILPRSAAVAAALVTGLALGSAPLVFAHAVIVEVHGLQLLLVTLTLAWFIFQLDPTAIQLPAWGMNLLAAGVGLGFGNHVTLVLLTPLFGRVGWRAWREPQARRAIWIQLGLVALGLLVYLYLPLAARGFPAINWGNPQTLEGFAWLVSGAPYRGFLAQPSPALILERLRSLPAIAVEQFGWPGALLGLWGALQFGPRQRRLAWLLVYVAGVFCTFSILYGSDDSLAYLLPALLVYAVWIGSGVASAWSWTWGRVPWGRVLVMGVCLAWLARLPSVRAGADPRAETRGIDFAETLLRVAPPGALVITAASEDTFPLWYLHFGLGQRRDLRVIVLSLTQFAWYEQTLVKTYPDLVYPPLDPLDPDHTGWGEQIPLLNPARPVCYTQADWTYACQGGRGP